MMMSSSTGKVDIMGALNIYWIETIFLEGPYEGTRYAFATYRDAKFGGSGFQVDEEYRHNAAYMVKVLSVTAVRGPVAPSEVHSTLQWARETYKNSPLLPAAELATA